MDTAYSRMTRVVAALALFVGLSAERALVAPLPQTMMPDTATAVGAAHIVHKGDVILRSKIYDTEVVTLDAPVSVTIAKFSQDIPAGTRLDPVLAPAKTSRLVGVDGRIYCGENQRTRSKFMEAMMGGMFSNYEPEVRFCFVDTNGDRQLDEVFLAGAKKQEDQIAIAIPPTAFTRALLQPSDDAGTVELRVDNFSARPEGDRIKLRLFVMRNGKEQVFSYINTVQQDKLKETYPVFQTNPAKVPYPAYFNNILGGEIGISRVDAAKGEAEVTAIRPFKTQLFRPVAIQVRYVFIYY